MPLAMIDDAHRTEFDAARFVSRYFQVLAWFSIASMIAGSIFFDSVRIDLLTPFVLFWAASDLKRRSKAARKWVLVIAWIALGLVVLALLWATIAGTDGMAIILGGRHIRNPALWQLTATAVPLAVMIGVPIAVLVSDRARRQFGGESVSP